MMDLHGHYEMLHTDVHTGEEWKDDVVDSGDDFIEDDWLNHHADGAQSGAGEE